MNTNTNEPNELTPLITQPTATTRRSFIKRTASAAIAATFALGAFENEARAEDGGGSSHVIFPVVALVGGTGTPPEVIVGLTGLSNSAPYGGGDFHLVPNDTESPMVHVKIEIEMSNLAVTSAGAGALG